MSSSAVAASAAILVYLLTHRVDIARRAVSLHLERHDLLAWMLGKVHSSVLHAQLVLNKILGAPDVRMSNFEHLSRFQFDRNGADLATVTNVRSLISALDKLTNTKVGHEQSFEGLKKVVDAESFHDLGFQTEDPANDFRGAGQFGLCMLEHFCAKPDISAIIIKESGSVVSLERSQAMEPWYPLALVSIRFSMKTSELLAREPVLALRINQLAQNAHWLDIMKSLHMYLLSEFHAKWVDARKRGKVRHYFDTEVVLQDFDKEMPNLILHFHTV